MPVLKNPRHEAFVRGWTEGLPAYRAYLDAGYECTPDAAMTKASQLVRKVEIQNRRRELLEELAGNMLVTRESLAAEYDQIAQAAFAEQQFAAAKSAVEAKQGVLGLDQPSKSLNVNINGNFNALTEDELAAELASMFNEVRAAAGKPVLELPEPKKH